MSAEPRTKAGLVASLVPLGFVIGFIAYTAGRTTASVWVLTVIALAGAAVPFTVALFAVSRRPRRET
ncbi:hypothetical protein [Saccharothrix deserti]|uniref:hypothetical protein n=1 Tax=Saccharothrix deserti TaxID=2593674 RepID=UPI00131D4CF6|nr:hypothetical protein [Saccharothrix deserti]